MTMFRGLADDIDLAQFLGRLLPAEDAVLAAETVAAGTALAIAECLRGGTTAALDMYFFPEAAAAVAAGTGFDLRGGPVFIEADGPDRRPFADRMAWAADLLAATPLDRRWVAPHSTYLLDERQLRAVGELAAACGARIHVHAAETATELAMVRARHGRSPIEVLRDTGLLGSGTVLAHGVHLDAADIALVASSGATVSHCPASNQKLASGFAPIPALLAAGVPVALGTDGAASANDLDMWLAMRLATYPLAARTAPGTVTADDVLAMATTAGAAGDGRGRPRHDHPRRARRSGRARPVVTVADAELRRPLHRRLRRIARRCPVGGRRWRRRRRRRPRGRHRRRRGDRRGPRHRPARPRRDGPLTPAHAAQPSLPHGRLRGDRAPEPVNQAATNRETEIPEKGRAMIRSKRVLAAGLVAVLGLAAAACGGDDDDNSTSATTAAGATATTAGATATTTAGSEGTSATTSGSTASSAGSTESTGASPETSAPTGTAAPAVKNPKIGLLYDITGRGDTLVQRRRRRRARQGQGRSRRCRHRVDPVQRR